MYTKIRGRFDTLIHVMAEILWIKTLIVPSRFPSKRANACKIRYQCNHLILSILITVGNISVHSPIIENNITNNWHVPRRSLCICGYEFNIAQTGMSTVTNYRVQLLRKKFKAEIYNFWIIVEFGAKGGQWRSERLETQTAQQACKTSVLPNCLVPAFPYSKALKKSTYIL